MTDKPSRNEDEYFAREDAEKLYRLHKERRKDEDQKRRDDEKAAHWMKCPKCGGQMKEVMMGADGGTVAVDQCTACGGVYFDAGELALLMGKQPGSSRMLDDLMGWIPGWGKGRKYFTGR